MILKKHIRQHQIKGKYDLTDLLRCYIDCANKNRVKK